MRCVWCRTWPYVETYTPSLRTLLKWVNAVRVCVCAFTVWGEREEHILCEQSCGLTTAQQHTHSHVSPLLASLQATPETWSSLLFAPKPQFCWFMVRVHFFVFVSFWISTNFTPCTGLADSVKTVSMNESSSWFLMWCNLMWSNWCDHVLNDWMRCLNLKCSEKYSG